MADRLAIIQSQESIREFQAIIDKCKEVVTNFKEVERSARDVNKALNSGRPRAYAEAISNLANVTQQYVAIERGLANSMARTARLEQQQANAALAQARARRETATAITEESRARQQVERETRQNTNTTNQNNSAHRQLTLQVRAARQTARDYGAQLLQLNERLRAGTISQREYRNQQRELQRNFQTTTREANRLQQQLNRLNQATTPSANRNGSLWGRVTDILKAGGIMKAVDFVTSSIMRLGQSAISTAIKLDTLRMAQMSVFKTSDEVAKQNQFLTSIAERYGIEIIGLTDSYTKFSASAQGTTLEGEKSKQIFDAVTKSSAMLGVSTDDTTGILRALGQMMSKGKVQAEELRGQLGDRMAGAFKLFADGMGVSTSELDAMLKKGTVLAEDVLPKFAAQLNKKYTLGIGDDINTNQANLNRITNEWVSFVEAVEGKSGIVSGSIKLVTGSIVSLLQALKPSTEITAIQQQQQEFNVLGIQLRQNWNDQKKRKEIIDQMIAVNPLFLDGLDKEKVTLEEISKRIQDVNAQYVQKIILQKQEEKIKELVEDQAIAYRDLSTVLVENAQFYNSLNSASKSAIDQYMTGAITQQKASDIIRKSTAQGSMEQSKAMNVLGKLIVVQEENRLTSDGWIRSINNGNVAIKNAAGEYNSLVTVTNKLFNVQGQLLNMNGLLAKSFTANGNAVTNQKKQFEEIFKVAEAQGKSIALINNVWRQKINGKWTTTDKKQTEGWYEEYGKLVKRESQKVAEKVEKPKAASLTAAQKDFIMIAQGVRDTEIANLKKQRIDKLIGEEEYQKGYQEIMVRYGNKIMSYLKGRNAKEIQVEGAAMKKAIEAVEEYQKFIYGEKSKIIEEQGKIDQNIIERQAKDLEKADFFSNTERLNKQVELDNEMIDQAEEKYKALIKLAQDLSQPVIEIERKRDEEIGKLIDARQDRYRAMFEATQKDIEKQTEFSNSFASLTYEQQRGVILSNKKLTISERERQLDILEKNHQIELNNAKIKELDALEKELNTRIAIATVSGVVNPEDVQQLANVGSQKEGLKNDNKGLNNEIKANLSDQSKAIRDIITGGLSDLGFQNVADGFTAMFDKIIDKTATWKDYSLLAAKAVFDGLSMLNQKQKEKRIADLDEQLKTSQATTDQELKFLDDRLSQLNNLDELSKEQLTERNKLEQEARGMKEQQLQREKTIAAQKARAEQRAAANQALINGALAATTTLASLPWPASIIPAALALGFGVAQSISIMSKDPVPQYWVGRNGGREEMAITQDRYGREFITDESGRIKNLGSDNGPQMTHLEKGDKVLTASKTKALIKNIGRMPKIGENVFRNAAMKTMIAPIIINNNTKSEDYSQAITAEVSKQVESATMKAFSMYSNPYIVKKKGLIIEYNGSKNPIILGEYDLQTLAETYFTED